LSKKFNPLFKLLNSDSTSGSLKAHLPHKDQALVEVVVAAAAEHQPINPVLLDLSHLSSVANWFFIASAKNSRQLATIADKIVRRATEHNIHPLGREGQGSDHWLLIDLGEIVIHLFNPETRTFYDLEGLWRIP
jgi:ribosome-associated protein